MNFIQIPEERTETRFFHPSEDGKREIFCKQQRTVNNDFFFPFPPTPPPVPCWPVFAHTATPRACQYFSHEIIASEYDKLKLVSFFAPVNEARSNNFFFDIYLFILTRHFPPLTYSLWHLYAIFSLHWLHVIRWGNCRSVGNSFQNNVIRSNSPLKGNNDFFLLRILFEKFWK